MILIFTGRIAMDPMSDRSLGVTGLVVGVVGIVIGVLTAY